jgi:hypothetical protein
MATILSLHVPYGNKFPHVPTYCTCIGRCYVLVHGTEKKGVPWCAARRGKGKVFLTWGVGGGGREFHHKISKPRFSRFKADGDFITLPIRYGTVPQ